MQDAFRMAACEEHSTRDRHVAPDNRVARIPLCWTYATLRMWPGMHADLKASNLSFSVERPYIDGGPWSRKQRTLIDTIFDGFETQITINTHRRINFL